MPADVVPPAALAALAAVPGSARRPRVSTLTKAESDDFAAAEVPLQVLTSPLPGPAPRLTPSSSSSRTPTPTHGKSSAASRFSFKAASLESTSIHETVKEEPASMTSPASSDGTSSLSTMTSAGRRVAGPEDFDLLCVIGQGAFGKVIQVRHQETDEILAMKIVSNKYIVKKNSVAYLQAERDIMTKINHPFLISLRYAFQTRDNVYLVMPFVAGGELFHHLHKEGLLLESAAKFYAAEMVLALEHLHSRGIIHRDLKPENILLGADGHIRLTDFGLAKEVSDEEGSTKTMCGTNEYMPPEMIRGKAYNQAVDWWALGALIFEMVTGYPPFRHKSRKKLHQKILNEKLPLPKWLGSETHSILKQLLERNVDKRLGSGKSTMFQVKGVQAIKKHPFFRDIDWHLLEQKKVEPPIVPNVLSNTDTTYFSEEFTAMAVGPRSRLDGHGGDGNEDINKLFARFSWVADDIPSFADVVRTGNAAPLSAEKLPPELQEAIADLDLDEEDDSA